MKKARLPRHGRAVPLDKSLSLVSSHVADRFLAAHYDGRAAFIVGRGITENFTVQSYRGHYLLGFRPTRAGFRVWSEVHTGAVPLDPLSEGTCFERYAHGKGRSTLKRKLERCILDAREECRRRTVLAHLVAVIQVYSDSAPFFDAMDLQKALRGWPTEFAEMRPIDGLKWLTWIRRYAEGQVPRPPSRQLSAYTGPSAERKV